MIVTDEVSKPDGGDQTSGRAVPHIGAFVLETLTLGMYGEPRHTLREYVQNSFDAIRAAQRTRFDLRTTSSCCGISGSRRIPPFWSRIFLLSAASNLAEGGMGARPDHSSGRIAKSIGTTRDGFKIPHWGELFKAALLSTILGVDLVNAIERHYGPKKDLILMMILSDAKPPHRSNRDRSQR
jgi:hypothetical protein